MILGDTKMVAREEPNSDYKKEVKNIWKEFFTDTTLHGCKPIQRSTKHYLQRLLWTGFVLTAGCFLVSYVIQLYVDFNKYPFETQYRMERVTNMKLPAISVCNMNQVSKAKYNFSKKTVNDMLAQNYFVRQFGNFSHGTISHEETDRIDGIPMEQMLINRDKFLLKAYVNDREVDIASEVVMYTSPIFNRCFTFNAVKEDGSGGQITLAHGQTFQILLNTNQSDYFPYCVFVGAHLIFHDPHDLPSPFGQGLDVAPGFSTYVTLEPTQYQFLTRPYKSYGDGYCEDAHGTSYGKKLLWHKRYSWVACVEECVIQAAVTECGCRPRLVPGFLSGRICSVEELYHCFFITAGKVQQKAINQNATECDCPQPCEFVHYGIRSSVSAFPTRQVADFLVSQGIADSYQEIRDNYLAVVVAFDGMILQHVEHVPTFNFGEILSRLGGQMGFFLGASLLTLTELTEAVILTIVSVFSMVLRGKRRSKNEDRQMIYSVKNKVACSDTQLAYPT